MLINQTDLKNRICELPNHKGWASRLHWRLSRQMVIPVVVYTSKYDPYHRFSWISSSIPRGTIHLRPLRAQGYLPLDPAQTKQYRYDTRAFVKFVFVWFLPEARLITFLIWPVATQPDLLSSVMVYVPAGRFPNL